MKTIAYIRSTSIYIDSRATKEIIAFAEVGYKVIVLGWNRDGKAREKCNEVFQGLDVEFLFFDLPTVTVGLKGITKLFRFFLWVYTTLSGKKESIDCVHMCDMDAAVGAALFCWKNHKPYVYDIFDYYVDAHPVPGFLRGIVERFDTEIINRATATIICIETRMEQIRKAHPKQVVVIHNSPEITNICSGLIEQDFSYCGGFGSKRLLKEILNEYKNNVDVSCKFAGNGQLATKVERVASKYANFQYVGPVAYSQVLDISSRSRILSAIYEPTIRNHRLCAPNKFYESLALGKPLIVCRGTGIDKIVEEHKLGVVIDYDAKQFYEAIRYLLAYPEECKKMGERGRKLFTEKYDWKIMKKRLLNVYKNIFFGGKNEV